jgi:hypothetical protein
MSESREGAPKPAPDPDAGRQHEAQQPRRSQPSFGPGEAEAVTDAQDQAVEQGGLPPSQDEAQRG